MGIFKYSKDIKLFFLTFVILFTTTSCDTLIGIISTVFQEPKISIKSFSLDKASIEKLNFKILFNVDNPNSVGIKTSVIDYNLDLNQNEIIKGNLTNGILINAKGSNDIEVPIEVSIPKILTLLPSLIFNSGSNIDYKVYGKISFDTPIGNIPIPWSKQDKIDIPKLIQ